MPSARRSRLCQRQNPCLDTTRRGGARKEVLTFCIIYNPIFRTRRLSLHVDFPYILSSINHPRFARLQRRRRSCSAPRQTSSQKSARMAGEESRRHNRTRTGASVCADLPQTLTCTNTTHAQTHTHTHVRVSPAQG